jgi:Fe-S cluster assembly protein SufD
VSAPAERIDEAAARRLVVRGFFASIIGRIGVPEVQEHLMAAIDVELEGVEGAAVAQEADDSEGAA